MASQAKVIIKGQNDIGPAVKAAAGDLSSLKGSADKLGGALKAAFSVTAIIAAVKMLGDAVSGCFTEFASAERSYKQLALALKDASSYDRITSVIEDLSTQTLSSKGDIESMVAELAALGKSTGEIESISSAAVYLSNVTGKDLNSSMTTLLNTYTGTTTQLKRLGIDLSGVTSEELAQGAAIDIVMDKLGDYSKMMAEDDTSQHLTNMKNTWGDIKQQIGGIIDYNFGPWFSNMDTAFSGMKTNLVSIINYVGAVIAHLPEAFKLTLSAIWEMIKRTFEWDSIKLVIITTVQNIGTVATTMMQAVFDTIPKMLLSIVSGIINWIAYIGINLQSTILGAIQNTINIAGEKIQGTWVGKLFGMGDKLAALDIGAADSSGKAARYKQQADQSFENIGPLLTKAVTDAVAMAQMVTGNTADMVQTIYGDIATDFKTALDEIVAPELEAIAQKADAANQTKILGQIAGNTADTASSSADTAENTKKTDTRMGDQVASLLSDGLTSMLSGLVGGLSGPILGMIADELVGGVAEIVSTVGPIMDILFNTLSPLGILLTILTGFVAVMEPALNTVFQPLVDAFLWIGQMLASVFLPVLEQVHTAFALIANIVMAVLSPILQSFAPIFSVLAGVMEALSPILILLAKAFTILMSPVQFLADLFSWLGSWIQYLGTVISTAAYNLVHPFRPKSYGSSPGAFSSDAFSGLADRLSNIDAIADGGSAVSDSVATSTAVSSAGYQGATQVTINIYQQAPVVGNNGMRAFAQLIRDEFEALNYYGVTA
jgi:hypothetical protein